MFLHKKTCESQKGIAGIKSSYLHLTASEH